MKKRIMSLALVLVMLFSVLPIMPARRSVAEETETLFDRYIPVNQAYSAKVSPFSVTQGVSYSFSIGTRFKDETAETIIFADELKRSEMQGQFFKINYLGTVGTLKKVDIMKYFDLKENDYLQVMGDPNAVIYENTRKWLTKDSIIISVDLYDEDSLLPVPCRRDIPVPFFSQHRTICLKEPTIRVQVFIRILMLNIYGWRTKVLRIIL